MKTFYIIYNIGCHGDFADIEQAGTDECRLIAVQGVALSDISPEERQLFGGITSAYLFQVQAEDYDAACDKLSQLMPEE
jgi:hypothetical protein